MEEKKSIYAAYEEIKAREISELKEAIKNSGHWKIKFDKENAPVVMCNFDGDMPHPCDVRILEVTLVDDNLNIYGEEKVVSGGAESYEGYYSIPKSSIAYGHIDFITSAIPNKKESEKLDQYKSCLCETVSELSHHLYGPLYIKLGDSAAVNMEIIKLAEEFEEMHDWNETDFLLQIDEFVKDYMINHF